MQVDVAIDVAANVELVLVCRHAIVCEDAMWCVGIVCMVSLRTILSLSALNGPIRSLALLYLLYPINIFNVRSFCFSIGD